ARPTRRPGAHAGGRPQKRRGQPQIFDPPDCRDKGRRSRSALSLLNALGTREPDREVGLSQYPHLPTAAFGCGPRVGSSKAAAVSGTPARAWSASAYGAVEAMGRTARSALILLN